MGIDTEIYFEADPDATIAPMLPSFEIKPFPDGESKEDAEGNVPTHYVYTLRRYYGVDYERGDWPTICAVLMSLISNEQVKRVWYFGDHMDLASAKPFSIDDVLALSRHYMTVGHRPYR